MDLLKMLNLQSMAIHLLSTITAPPQQHLRLLLLRLLLLLQLLQVTERQRPGVLRRRLWEGDRLLCLGEPAKLLSWKRGSSGS
jgi:hypothetical protein